MTGDLFKLTCDLRADARLNALDPAAWTQLFAIVSAGDKPAFKKFLAAHKIEIAKQNEHRQWNRLAESATNLLKRSALLDAAREVAKKNNITLTQAALEQAVVGLGDVLDAAVDPHSPEGQQLLLKGLMGLTGARSVEVSADRVGVAKGALAVAERRVKLLEDNAAAAKAKLTTVVKKGGLTKQAIRTIEEAAGLL